MKKYNSLLWAILLLIPFSAMAHGAHGTGFMAGFTHPIFGLDHVVVILGLGVLAYALLEKRQWLPSLIFVLAMVLGGVLGIKAEAFAITEVVIVLSVLVVGLLLALDFSWPFVAIIILAALFGFFHGHAHGTEMPENSNVPLYILGFVVGAGLLSAIGMAIARQVKDPVHIRLLGAFVAGMSLVMFLA